MFGYLVCNAEILDKQQKEEYKKYYCSLCESLHQSYGNIGRATLSYDLTFFAMLLDSLQKSDGKSFTKRCPIQPLRNQPMISNNTIDYCADINLLLTYYKCIDDINDDNSLKAKKLEKKLKPHIDKISDKYNIKLDIIKTKLNEISGYERENILNPDLPANAFGELFSEMFIYKYVSDDLRKFGYHLGKFIYLMDAVMDFKKDLKSESYNPLVTISSSNHKDMLLSVMEDVDYYYSKLPVTTNKDILDNIIYSGLWTKYNLEFARKEK